MDAELDIDIDDPNQLLTLLKSKLEVDDIRNVTSLIQNIVVGTALIDKETRSYMLAMIGKVVMYIVLDQNGITNFSDAFQFSVDQIIAGLGEVEQLREENSQLTVICEYQEKELMERKKLGDRSGVAGEFSVEELREHKKHLRMIRDAILKPNANINRGDSSVTVSGNGSEPSATKTSTDAIDKPPPPIPVTAFSSEPLVTSKIHLNFRCRTSADERYATSTTSSQPRLGPNNSHKVSTKNSC